jgi:hypothetical protein
MLGKVSLFKADHFGAHQYLILLFSTLTLQYLLLLFGTLTLQYLLLLDI